MTLTDQPSVDNGVNVQALLDAAKAALTDAPEAARFQWRATLPVGRRHPQPHDRRHLLRPRRGAVAPTEPSRSTPTIPELFAVRGPRHDAGRDGAGRLGGLPHGRGRGRRHEPRRAAPLGHRDSRRRHGHPGHPRHRPRSAQRLRQDHRALRRSTPTRRGATSRRSWPSRRSARPSSTSSPTRRTSSSRSSDGRGGHMHVGRRVGAGPAGLAVSGCLTAAGVDHVVLDRHRRRPLVAAASAGTRCAR